MGEQRGGSLDPGGVRALSVRHWAVRYGIPARGTQLAPGGHNGRSAAAHVTCAACGLLADLRGAPEDQSLTLAAHCSSVVPRK